MDSVEIARLSPEERRTLLRRLLEQANNQSAEPAPLELRPDPAARFEPFPLTEVQQAYVLGRTDAFALGNTACFIYLELDVSRHDPAALEAGWRALVDRHDMLRVVATADGRQRVIEWAPRFDLPVEDLRGLPADLAEARRVAIREAVCAGELPLERYPLWDLRATRMPDERVILHVRIEMFGLDAISMLRLFAEWQQAVRRGAERAPPLPLTFRDATLAAAALPPTDASRRAEAYWLDRKATLPGGPELPLALDPAALVRPRFARLESRLAADTWRRLKARAAQVQLSPSAILALAFAEVLAAWSRSPHFTLNLTTFQRLPFPPPSDEILGEFTSTLLLEVDLRAPTFRARAAALARRLAADLDHSGYSGVRLLREMSRERGFGGMPAMPVVFTSMLGHSREQQPAPFAWLGEVLWGLSQTPQVALDHQVAEFDGALQTTWDHVESLFPAGMLPAMFAAYCTLLHRLADDDAVWDDAHLIVTPAADRALADAANATSAPAAEHTLLALVHATVQRTPQAPAIVQGEQAWTYEELWARASAVAEALTTAEPGRLVAVFLERGPWQSAATLGTWIAGGAYLPIAADLPDARVRHLLEHGQVVAVVTSRALAARAVWPAGLRPICVEDLGRAWAEPPRRSLADLAYVIYTSGSTGAPKGVMIDHRGAVETILDIQRRFAVGPHDRVLGLSSLGFDLSVFDLFGTFAAGGALVLPPSDAGSDPAVWLACLRDHGVTIWNSVPALLELLVGAAGDAPQPGPLRLALLSGDWIPVSLPDAFRRRWPAAQVVSLGGATEGSIWSIVYPIGAVDPAWPSIPYGKPLANQRFHALDAGLRPRPVGVPGELYIGGSGVALGYWRDPQQTAERFVIHPVSGERLYRTGDWGRLLPSGDLEFLGRADQQVKIGGHRVELGEIEAALLQLPGVRAAAVAAPVCSGHTRALVGYVVLAEGHAFAPRALEAELLARLPAYLVPRAWRALDALPLSANGKVDRQRLLAFAPVEAPTAAPVDSPVLRQVLAVCREVLGRPELTAETDLFRAGAASVQFISVATLLARQLGSRPAMPLFLRLTTPAAIAGWYSEHGSADMSSAELEEGEL